MGYQGPKPLEEAVEAFRTERYLYRRAFLVPLNMQTGEEPSVGLPYGQWPLLTYPSGRSFLKDRSGNLFMGIYIAEAHRSLVMLEAPKPEFLWPGEIPDPAIIAELEAFKASVGELGRCVECEADDRTQLPGFKVFWADRECDGIPHFRAACPTCHEDIPWKTASTVALPTSINGGDHESR